MFGVYFVTSVIFPVSEFETISIDMMYAVVITINVFSNYWLFILDLSLFLAGCQACA